MGLFDFLFGSKAQAGHATAANAATPDEVKQASAGASGLMGGYDTQTASDTAGGAAATMQRAQDAARATAAGQSDQAVAQAIKAGRTAGMMPGQAALAGGAQAANAYGTGLAQGVDQYGQNVQREAQLGESMSGRLAQSGATQAQINEANAAGQNAIAQANASNQTSASNQNASKGGLFGQIAGVASGIGSLFSDRNLKDNIKPSGSISDSLAKIKSYSYKYKGSNKPEAGVMAQDLEKTKAAPSVYNTPQGKAIDTNRLTSINTAAISEQGRRLKEIESIIHELKGVKHA